MNKIKKININIKNMKHIFYNFLFLDVEDKILKLLPEKYRLIITEEMSIYCANNICVIIRNNKILKIIKKKEIIDKMIDKDPILKESILKGMNEKIDFYETENIAEKIIFLLSGKKLLNTEDIFINDDNLRMASLLPEIYGEIIKESIKIIKSKKNRRNKIIETLQFIEDKKLSYEIFKIEDSYNSTEYNKILKFSKNKEDIIGEILKDEKYGLNTIYNYIIKELNKESKFKELKLKATFFYLIKSKKIKKDILSEIKNKCKFNRHFTDFYYSVY